MSSPKSMWSGSISLGLLNLPITIGKTWSDERVTDLVTLCKDHKVKIDRTERCGKGEKDCTLEKVKGVQVSEGEFRVLSDNEYEAIETATKDEALRILDVQKIQDLPLDYGTGSYYIRHDTKAKGVDAKALATFTQALYNSDLGVVVKWASSANQKLAVIHTTMDGTLLLTTIPYVTEWRPPGKAENEAKQVEVDPAEVRMMRDLLKAQGQESFDHSRYSNVGVVLRAQAVEKILAGEKLDEKPEPKEQGQAVNLMAQMKASIEAAKVTENEAA